MHDPPDINAGHYSGERLTRSGRGRITSGVQELTSPHREGADSRLLRVAGTALPGLVWLLLMVSPPRNVDLAPFAATLGALLSGLAVIERFGPAPEAPVSRRILAYASELALCFVVVQVHGSYIRPALVYLVPASRAVLGFGDRWGLLASLAVWLAYGLNVALFAWPDRPGDFLNYFSFFLAPYTVALALTLATVRQAGDRARLQSLYDQLRLAHEQLQALHNQGAELAVTQERNRLAREIHDSIAHYLTVTAVQLEAAEKLAAKQPARALEHIQRARRLTTDCLQDVRRSVAALRASSLDELSLPRALEKLAAGFGSTTGLRVDLDCRISEETRVPPETAMALFRAVQEGLTNVQRHAQASTVRIVLGRNDESLELRVTDNGMGPPDVTDGPGEDGGFGLLGLRERVALLGGTIALARSSLGGAELSVLVPISERV